ncbi:MAG: cytochrome C [Phyllobacteriaceae bacterium]|nr:cytochrome C [Phyllobacteriaceae bacterium]MBA91727.1 cytochrome C [Phyllobacteriaceae bacterium]
MSQLFGPHFNGIARFVLWGGAALVLVLIAVAAALPRSALVTGTDRVVAQPVPFSHKHHAGELGIDCRYCHTGVETSSFAGLPPTETCMTCHSQLWTNAGMLAPVRQSLSSGKPIAWNRVHDLPDYVYFNHAIHVDKGVGCTTCHGRIDRMAMTWQAKPLTMSWCLDCHRDPEPNLRPKEAVFETGWQPPDDIARLRALLMKEENIHPETMTDCYVCHR